MRQGRAGSTAAPAHTLTRTPPPCKRTKARRVPGIAHGNTGKGKAAELPHDAVTTWIHVEIDRETDREDLQQITADLLRVLSDVREAVEDWEKMRGAALRIADELPSEPTADDLRDQEIDEARELLRWLSADHFTFLGYREYELVSAPGEGDAEEQLVGEPTTAATCYGSWGPARATSRAPLSRPAGHGLSRALDHHCSMTLTADEPRW